MWPSIIYSYRQVLIFVPVTTLAGYWNKTLVGKKIILLAIIRLNGTCLALRVVCISAGLLVINIPKR